MDRQKEAARRCRIILEFGRRCPRLNVDMYDEMLDKYEAGRFFTNAQIAAIDNVWTKFHVGSWVKKQLALMVLTSDD